MQIMTKETALKKAESSIHERGQELKKAKQRFMESLDSSTIGPDGQPPEKVQEEGGQERQAGRPLLRRKEGGSGRECPASGEKPLQEARNPAWNEKHASAGNGSGPSGSVPSWNRGASAGNRSGPSMGVPSRNGGASAGNRSGPSMGVPSWNGGASAGNRSGPSMGVPSWNGGASAGNRSGPSMGVPSWNRGASAGNRSGPSGKVTFWNGGARTKRAGASARAGRAAAGAGRKAARAGGRTAAKAGASAATAGAAAGVFLVKDSAEAAVKASIKAAEKIRSGLASSAGREAGRGRKKEKGTKEGAFPAGKILLISGAAVLFLFFSFFTLLFPFALCRTEEKEPEEVKIAAAAEGELAAAAENTGGEKYKAWYGIDGNWCAIFVAYCADQCGYLERGIVPRTASVANMKRYFKESGLYHSAEEGYVPKAGDLIFFGSGMSHVGIVTDYDPEQKIITAIEGNSGRSDTEPYHKGSRVSKKRYSTDYVHIAGFASPDYPEEDMPEEERGMTEETVPGKGNTQEGADRK